MNVNTNIDFDIDIDDIWCELESYVESTIAGWNEDDLDLTNNSEFNRIEEHVGELESRVETLASRIGNGSLDGENEALRTAIAEYFEGYPDTVVTREHLQERIQDLVDNFHDTEPYQALDTRIDEFEQAMSDFDDRLSSDDFDLTANPQFEALRLRVTALERGEGPIRNAVHAVTSGPDAMRNLNDHIDARVKALAQIVVREELVRVITQLFTK